MAPLDPTPHCRRRLPAEVRRVVYFSALLLFLNFLRLVLSPHVQPFPSALLTTRPAFAKPLIVMFSPHVQNGLGAQVLHMLDAASLAHFAGPQARLCVRESRYWNYGCGPQKGWSCYFAMEPCPDFAECPEFSRLLPRDVWNLPCVQVSSRLSASRLATVSRLLAREHPVSPMAYFRHLAHALWRLNPDTAERVATLTRNTGLARASYVALHVRRGDKRKEAKLVALLQYARAVRLVAHAGEPVFVATDDGRVLRTLRGLLPGHELVALASTKSRRGHLQARQNRIWMKARYDSVVDLLGDVEMMRRARVFVGTFSSNLGRLVHVLRTGDERDSISLDDRWAPGVAWRTFGQSYCAWPGSNETFCRDWLDRK